MAIDLIPLCTVQVTLRDPIDVGVGPAGWRMVYEVADAVVSGDRMRGRLRGQAAADWLLVGGTTGMLDVRATVESDDGAVVFTHYCGRTDLSNGAGVAPIYVTPVFETGDERYAWLNSVQAVGKGIIDGNRIDYEWYELR